MVHQDLQHPVYNSFQHYPITRFLYNNLMTSFLPLIFHMDYFKNLYSSIEFLSIAQTSHIDFAYTPWKFNVWKLFGIHKCLHQLINFLSNSYICSVSMILNIWSLIWNFCIHVMSDSSSQKYRSNSPKDHSSFNSPFSNDSTLYQVKQLLYGQSSQDRELHTLLKFR